MEHIDFTKNLDKLDQEEEFEEHYLSCSRCFEAVHKRIDSEELIDGYVLGKLTPQIQEFLEKHCLACQTCFQQLGETEKAMLALKEAAKLNEIEFDELETSQLADIIARLKKLTLSPAFVVSTAVLVMMLIYPAYLGIVQLPELNSQLQQLHVPQANPISYSLQQERSRGGLRLITLPKDDPARLFTLTFTLLEKKVANPKYTAEIADHTGKVIWQQENLIPAGDFDVFAIVCRRAFFREGQYELKVLERDSVDLQITDTFVYPFEIAFVTE